MMPPVLQVPRLKQALDQRYESAVVNVSPDDVQQDRVVDVVEASLDVALDEPDRTLPLGSDVAESRMATPARPKAVGQVAEPLFVVGLQKRPQNLLDQFIRPGRDAQRACLAVRFRDFRPPNGRPFIALVPQASDDAVDLRESHSVHRFLGGTLRRRTGVPVDLTVGA